MTPLQLSMAQKIDKTRRILTNVMRHEKFFPSNVV